MQSPDLRLHSLFLSLFEKGELRRFARHTFGERLGYELDAELSTTEQAERLVRYLRDEGLIDERLFEALAASRPDRRDLVNEVRREVLGEERAVRGALSDAEPPSATEPLGGEEAVSDERAAWRRSLSALLDAVPLERLQPGPEWIEAAAVLPAFSPFKLRPVGAGAGQPPADLLERLSAVCDVLPGGLLSLELEPRQEALARLVREERLQAALDANPDDSAHGRVLRRAVALGRVDARMLGGLEELKAAYDVAQWLAPSGVEPFDRDQLASLLERQRRIEPLRRLLGRHFRGRLTERERLHRHLACDDGDGVLSLWGVGGVGKSALLGKVLLELEKEGVPWVYVDFDHRDADPLRPRRLVELIARQLAQFFAAGGGSRQLVEVESAAAGVDLGFTPDLGGEASLERLLGLLDDRLRERVWPPRLAVVFDTFEQVQVRGTRATELTRSLVDDLLAAMPYARVVVSGRARADWKGAGELALEDLDPESADEVLIALDVTDPELRSQVVQRVGTSPLSLRLSAEALAARQLDAEDMEELVLQVSELERQGQLYTRILGHIRDREVRRMAHPGLIVRRVTPAVIREVLAEVCDIDPQRAEVIFERLPHHVALFEPGEATAEEGRALRHRQDVREKMLQLMLQDPGWTDRIDDIHDRAIDHYAGRDDLIARAEEIYHRLWRDDDPEIFDHRWEDELAESLSRCWNEPLPERARAWLGPRIGRTHGDLEAWRTQDWEVSAERDARARLASEDAEGALEVLRRRAARSAGSRLHRLEAEALAQLGRWDEAAAVVDRGLEDVVAAGRLDEALQLHLRGAEIALERSEAETAERHLDRAMGTAERLGDARGSLEVLELRVRSARRRGETDEAARRSRQLEQLFVQADEVKLRRDPELSRRLLRELDAGSAPVLRKAAAAFGNRTDQEVIRPDAFLLGDLLERFDATPGGHEELSRLAGEVGLSKSRFKIEDLASQTIRYNKLGDALVTVLDHSGHDEDLRRGTARMFSDLGGDFEL